MSTTTTSTATTTPVITLVEKLNNITQHCKNIVATKKEYDYPVVIAAIAEYGAENIYLVANHYHGRYEDDYADFTYYNNVTGEYFSDNWTTAAACPAYSSYECMYISEAWENNLVDKEKLYQKIYKQTENTINNLQFNVHFSDNIEVVQNMGLRVDVYKGRKWKGIGFLVDTFTTTYQWDTPRWRSRYYGDNGYGRTTTRHAKVLDPATGTINTVTFSNLKFLDIDKFVQEYKEECLKKLSETTNINLVVGNYSFNYSPASGDSHNVPMWIDYKQVPFIEWMNEKHSNKFDLSIFVDVEWEKELKKLMEFKETKMPDIIEWVKNNTNCETEEDINQLAEHIFEKRYNPNYYTNKNR